MTEFGYTNLPVEEFTYIEALPDEMFAEVQDVFKEAIESGLALVQEAKAAYVYDRKDYFGVDDFSGKRNASYGSSTDDIVIQLTVRVPNPNTIPHRLGEEKLTGLTALQTTVTEYKQAAERARLEAEIAAVEKAIADANTLADEKRKQLETLKAKQA